MKLINLCRQSVDLRHWVVTEFHFPFLIFLKLNAPPLFLWEHTHRSTDSVINQGWFIWHGLSKESDCKWYSGGAFRLRKIEKGKWEFDEPHLGNVFIHPVWSDTVTDYGFSSHLYMRTWIKRKHYNNNRSKMAFNASNSKSPASSYISATFQALCACQCFFVCIHITMLDADLRLKNQLVWKTRNVKFYSFTRILNIGLAN